MKKKEDSPIKNKEEIKKEISWRAAEYDYVKKDISWFWIVGGVATALVLVAIWQGNFFFAVFIALAGAVVLFFGRRRPQILDFKINEVEVRIGKIEYKFELFENFSFRKRPMFLDEIVLKKKTAFNPYVKIPIDSKLAEEVKSVLLEKLPEVEYQESLIEIFSDWLGF
ncbi:MAG: hypothetical protein QMD65_03535 [Patescibacteria group bacterium]|nr:hypothetical protein [Patescibacteria group bacterium]